MGVGGALSVRWSGPGIFPNLVTRETSGSEKGGGERRQVEAILCFNDFSDTSPLFAEGGRRNVGEEVPR